MNRLKSIMSFGALKMDLLPMVGRPRRKAGWVYVLVGSVKVFNSSPCLKTALCDTGILGLSRVIAAFLSCSVYHCCVASCLQSRICFPFIAFFGAESMISQSSCCSTNTHPIFPNGFGKGSTKIPDNVLVEAPSA